MRVCTSHARRSGEEIPRYGFVLHCALRFHLGDRFYRGCISAPRDRRSS